MKITGLLLLTFVSAALAGTPFLTEQLGLHFARSSEYNLCQQLITCIVTINQSWQIQPSSRPF